MTSKLVVNTIESDTGISSVSFASSISMSSTSKFHFSNAGIDIGADTNINRPASGVLGFNINSSEKVRINSNGFIGINTSSILAPLHTYNDTNNTIARLESGDATCRLQLKDSAGEGYVVASGDNLILANTSSITERLRITSSGEVGINMTPSNGQMLAITGRSGYDDVVQVTAVGTNMGARINLTNTGTGVARINATNNSLELQTAGNNRLRILSSGEISIGGFAAGASAGVLQIAGGLRVAGSASASDTYSPYIYRTSGSDHLNFATSGNERVRITSTGQFIVGTNSSVSSGNIVHIEAPTSFNSGETIVNIEGDNATAGPRLLLSNNNTGGSAHGEILGVDAGGQSTSSIRFYNTDQSNNYGEIAFGTRNVSNAPPADRMRISKDGYVTKPNNPSFAASRNGGNVGNGNTIVFNSVKFNVGGHYNNTNGRFTAPIAGKYQFSVACMAYGGSGDFQVRIGKNGSNYFNNNGSGRGYSTFEPYGFTVMMDMAVGDYAEITVYSSMSAVVYGTGAVWNIFSGHLVS